MSIEDQPESIIHVRLTNEEVLVWRPVKAQKISNDTFLIIDQPIPKDEEWEFQPGEVVRVIVKKGDKDEYRAAVKAIR